MSVKFRDLCVMCSKIIKDCHKNITCKQCNGYTHKKCTKLRPTQLKSLNHNEWVCSTCITSNLDNNNSDDESSDGEDYDSKTFDITDVDLTKYDNMIFNPLTFDCNSINKCYNDVDSDDIHECMYLTPEKFCSDSTTSSGKFNFLNVNIRSLTKNLDNFKECLKTLNCNFNIIGVSETHLKEKPTDYLNLPGYNIEYTNRIGREKGGVCMYISEKVKYKLRKDLCHANSNYESCFIEIESQNDKNML